MPIYTAHCSHCGDAVQAADAFDIIRLNKWKLEVQRNRKGKIITTIWHCSRCKAGNRQSQAPHA